MTTNSKLALTDQGISVNSAQRIRLNRAQAIREFCRECVCYQTQSINGCPDTFCALWEWRRGPGAPERTSVPLRRQIARQTSHIQNAH
jgi:hypothetical protein